MKLTVLLNTDGSTETNNGITMNFFNIDYGWFAKEDLIKMNKPIEIKLCPRHTNKFDDIDIQYLRDNYDFKTTGYNWDVRIIKKIIKCDDKQNLPPALKELLFKYEMDEIINS